MNLPTWGELTGFYCSKVNNGLIQNHMFEQFSVRRYNYGVSHDKNVCRLVFLKDVLKNKANKTLRRGGRFIWCANLKYEGRNTEGFRQISFTVDKGKKRFLVAENNVLCVPSKIYVNNSRYFRSKVKTFTSFSSVFGYKNTLNMMAKADGLTLDEFEEKIKSDNPFKPGTLVSPRLGYFFPQIDPNKVDLEIKDDAQHPCGIILGRQFLDDHHYVGKEFYRVRFGDTTYERVHPVQMEVINEV
jgi:hypothetical protein